MSVVLITDHFHTIRRVVGLLRDQTVHDQIEVVMVVPSRQAAEVDAAALEGFAGVRVVEVGAIHPMSGARAAGVRNATAPVVFLGETHSFPHPEFAARLIAAHEKPWDVVVPGLRNANPGSALSWASFLMDYGPWSDELPPGEIAWGPTWNVAYKRAVLMELDGTLGSSLAAGDELASALRARRTRVYHEPAARLDHVNVSRPGSWTDERYLTGLLIASNRKSRWPLRRRLLYILASPLIPAVLLSRMVRPVRHLMRKGALPTGTLPALLIGLFVRTLGEVVGYSAGQGRDSATRMERYELHKLKYTVREA